jgi:hypothetical protein
MTSPLQQKLKIHGPVVITANRLGDGAVIYRTVGGEWSTDISTAAVATTAEHAKTLLAAAQSDYVNAVDPYVAPVELTEKQKIVPGNLRERIRLAGPTVALPGA